MSNIYRARKLIKLISCSVLFSFLCSWLSIERIDETATIREKSSKTVHQEIPIVLVTCKGLYTGEILLAYFTFNA